MENAGKVLAGHSARFFAAAQNDIGGMYCDSKDAVGATLMVARCWSPEDAGSSMHGRIPQPPGDHQGRPYRMAQ